MEYVITFESRDDPGIERELTLLALDDTEAIALFEQRMQGDEGLYHWVDLTDPHGRLLAEL